MEISNPSKSPERKSRLFTWLDPTNFILFISLILALGFLVFKAQANHSLAQENEALKTRLKRNSPLEAGNLSPSFFGTNLQGQPSNIIYNGSDKQLVFIFSAHCPACQEEIGQWNEIATQAKGKKITMTGLSLDPLADTKNFFGNKQLAFNVLLADDAILSAYPVSSVPQLLLISGRGIVEWSHKGRLNTEDWHELQSKI